MHSRHLVASGAAGRANAGLCSAWSWLYLCNYYYVGSVLFHRNILWLSDMNEFLKHYSTALLTSVILCCSSTCRKLKTAHTGDAASVRFGHLGHFAPWSTYLFSVAVPWGIVLCRVVYVCDRARGSVQVSLVQSEFCLHRVRGRPSHVRLPQLLGRIPTSTSLVIHVWLIN